MKCFCWGPYLHTQLFDEGKREEKLGVFLEFKSGSKGKYEYEAIWKKYLGLEHI